MTQTIVLKGKQFTKRELEEALKVLEERNSFLAGDIVCFKNGHSINKKFVVVSKYVSEIIRRKFPHITHDKIVLIGLSDGQSYSPHPDQLMKVR